MNFDEWMKSNHTSPHFDMIFTSGFNIDDLRAAWNTALELSQQIAVEHANLPHVTLNKLARNTALQIAQQIDTLAAHH